jgi:hypothetical protein
MENVMEQATLWFNANQLKINSEKTENIIFTLNKPLSDDTEYNYVKLLGIYLDSKLTWETHTQEVCKKLSRIIYLMRKLKSSVSRNMLITAYYAFFHPHLLYGIRLWGNSNGSTQVFKWQKKAIRIIKVSIIENRVEIILKTWKL